MGDCDGRSAAKINRGRGRPPSKAEAMYLFGRKKWSEEDEIRILEAILHYNSKLVVSFDMNSFFFYVKQCVPLQRRFYSFHQLKNKIDRLKCRHSNSKQVTRGGDRLRSHDNKMFTLAGAIWGSSQPTHKDEGNSKVFEFKLMIQQAHFLCNNANQALAYYHSINK